MIMIKTYYIDDVLGYITLPAQFNIDKVTLDHRLRSVWIDEPLIVLQAFLGDTEEESEIKARNWFTSRDLDINDINNWYYKDMSNHAMIFKTYSVS